MVLAPFVGVVDVVQALASLTGAKASPAAGLKGAAMLFKKKAGLTTAGAEGAGVEDASRLRGIRRLKLGCLVPKSGHSRSEVPMKSQLSVHARKHSATECGTARKRSWTSHPT